MKSEWQPIESAPKDGTLVLVVDGRGKMMIWSGLLLAHAMAESTPSHLRFAATHWMPLPEAPRER